MVTLPVTSVRIIHSVSYSVISQAVDVTRISISKTLESTPTVLHKINCDVNAIECRQFYEWVWRIYLAFVDSFMNNHRLFNLIEFFFSTSVFWWIRLNNLVKHHWSWEPTHWTGWRVHIKLKIFNQSFGWCEYSTVFQLLERLLSSPRTESMCLYSSSIRAHWKIYSIQCNVL